MIHIHTADLKQKPFQLSGDQGLIHAMRSSSRPVQVRNIWASTQKTPSKGAVLSMRNL